MLKDSFKPEEIPAIRVAAGQTVEDVKLTDLESVGTGYAYGISVGDVVEFPETENDVVLKKVPVSGSAYQYLVLVKKNDKPAWFGVSNLRRQDNERNYVHPVAQDIADQITEKALPTNDETRLRLMLGKKITAEEAVKYNEAVFVDGVSTGETRERSVAKVIYA